jgi:hypothetical protein
MAELDIGNSVGFVDKRQGRGTNGSSVVTELANFGSIKLMRDRLTALNSTYYTAARLNTMTRNDMVYALRMASSDAAGI